MNQDNNNNANNNGYNSLNQPQMRRNGSSTRSITRRRKPGAHKLSSLAPVSLLSLQQFIFFEFYYLVIYTGIITICFIFKYEFLPYPLTYARTYEVICFICLIMFSFFKLRIGTLGNKSESSSFMQWFLILSFGAVAGFIFFTFFQTYVLELEFILNLIELGFVVINFVLGIVAFVSFKRIEKTMYF